MDKVELILLDKNLNVFNHTISTPGIESAFLSQSPGWRKECVRRALWTEDSKYLVGVTWDYIDYIEGMAYVFNRKGEIIRRFTKGVTGGAGALIPQSLNASGRYLLSGNSYSRVLDLENNFVITELSNLSQPLWHPCGNIFLVVIDGVLVAYDTNTIEIDISNKATLKGIELIKGVKKLLAISPSGRFAYLLYETSVNNTLANNSNSGSGLEKLKPYLVKLDLATLKNKQWDIPVKNMVCTYDDNYVVVETEYCQIQLLDAESGEVIKKAYGKTVRGWMQNTQHALYAAISGQNPFMLAYPKELEVNKNSYATITRFWDYETKRLNQPKLVCPHCGKPFIPDKNLVNPLPIKVVLLDNFKQAFSPLNQNARNYLSCDCPNCGMHIYVNPFMA